MGSAKVEVLMSRLTRRLGVYGSRGYRSYSGALMGESYGGEDASGCLPEGLAVVRSQEMVREGPPRPPHQLALAGSYGIDSKASRTATERYEDERVSRSMIINGNYPIIYLLWRSCSSHWQCTECRNVVNQTLAPLPQPHFPEAPPS